MSPKGRVDRGAPSERQLSAIVATTLQDRGRLTMIEAGRACAHCMLGDWNRMEERDRTYWIQKAQALLESLAMVLPVYDLDLGSQAIGRQGGRRTIRVWYWRGREPIAQLEKDLEIQVEKGIER